jgi:CheY-like chemotaxis protein
MKKLRKLSDVGAGAKPKDTILYVEDEKDNWDVAQLRLSGSYDLIWAVNDKEACREIRTRGKGIAAILMDIQLGGSLLNGIELTQLVRGKLARDTLPDYAKDVPTLDIPILFVTAYASRYSEQELLGYGANQLITKPVSFGALSLALTTIMLSRVANRA